MIKFMRDYISETIFDVEVNNESNQAQWTRYYIELFMVSLIKFLEILISSILLGVVLDTLIVYFSFGFVRIQARGWHANQSWLCSLESFLLFVGLPVVTRTIDISGAVKTILIICGCFTMAKYAPQTTRKNPISDQNELKYRKTSAIVLMFMLGIGQFLPLQSVSKNLSIAMGIQIFVVLPITKKIMEGRYFEIEKNKTNSSKHDE